MGLNKEKTVEKLFKRLSLIDRSINRSSTIKNIEEYLESNQNISFEIKSLTKELNTLNKKIDKIKSIQRKVSETSDILLGNGPKRISLILKKQSGNQYIKARCYWEGKQREVQIAPLSGIVGHLATLSLINPLKLSLKNTDNITWDTCRANNTIYKAIITLARIKFQIYIVSRINVPSVEIVKKSLNNLPNVYDITNQNPHSNKSTWYESWRKKTQG
tara:strand:- start:382 stop:1032 length:651 start_codon:yes stop_codon:yes gene_type:complete